MSKENGVSDQRLLEVKLLLRPDEVANILRISKPQVYVLCAEGVLDTVRIKRSLRIRTESVRELLQSES